MAREEARRWKRIFDDLSDRPGLERPQAEAIAHRARALDSATDERKQELQRRLDARFGVVAKAPAPIEPAVPQEAKVEMPKAAKKVKAQVVRVEPRATTKTKKRPAKRVQRTKEPPDLPRGEFERRLSFLMLRLGTDRVKALIEDMGRLG